MANVQTLLQPISVPGNQPVAIRSQERATSDTQGNRVDAADSLNDGDINAEHSFSKLLNNSSSSKPIETSQNRRLDSNEVRLNSASPSLLETAELNPLGGNELPFEGQTLPPSTVLVIESLAKGFYQISEDLQRASGFPNGVADDVLNVGFAPDNEAITSIESPQYQGAAILSVELSDERAIAAYNATLTGDASDAQSSLLADIGEAGSTVDATFTISQADPVLVPEPVSQSLAAESELMAADTLLEQGPKVFSQFNGEQLAGSGVKSSQLDSAAIAASINQNEAIIPNGVKQGRGKGVEFQSAIDIAVDNPDAEAEAEFSKFEGIISSLNSRGGEKPLPSVPGNLLAPTVADSAAGAAQNTGVSNGNSLTNALSQWRESQDSSAVNADPLERQSFTKLSVPFNQTGWGENLGKQLSLLLAKNMDSAQIQLDPPELGPLGVKIQINQDQVSLHFTSGHSVVREALEQSSQRLQQMLNDEGLELIDVGVSDQKSGQNDDSNGRDDKAKDQSTPLDLAVDRTKESDGLLTDAQRVTIDDGNIDYFV